MPDRRPGRAVVAGRAPVAALLVAAGALLAAAPPAAPAPPAGSPRTDPFDPFEPCERQVRAQPEKYEGYLCFHTEARASDRWREAEQRIERLESELPFAGWALLVRGHLNQLRDEPRALASYRAAAEAFAEHGEARGEILARHNLRNMLHRRGEAAAARAEVERVLEVAERSGKPALVAQSLVLEGTHLVETGGDLARARHALRRAWELLPADSSYPQRKLALLALGNVAFQLGRYDEAVETYERLLALTQENRDGIEEATTRFNIVHTRQRQFEERPQADALKKLEPLAQETLASALRAGNRYVEVRARAMLAQLARARGERELARRLLEEALAGARVLGHPERILVCLWSLAELLADDDPVAAIALDAEATSLALETGSERHLAWAWRSRMRIAWRALPPAEAVATSLRALGAIESLAAAQAEEGSTVEQFGTWARDYRWLAGRLLEQEPPAVDAAFEVLERMRARALLAALAAAEKAAPDDDGAGAGGEREAAALRDLIAVQRGLLAPGLGSRERDALLARLESREIELAAARAAAAGAERDPGDFAALAEVRRRLAPNEALLVFQIAPRRDLYGDFAGGSWAIVVTSEGATVLPLADRPELDSLVAVFLALVERRDGAERAAAAGLRELLLAAPLAVVPPRTERLLVAPDGALFALPFELLAAGAGPEAEPLGVRYELAVVPSATALLRWRGSGSPPPRRSVLALADPEFTGAAAAAAPARAAVLGDLLALGRLPGAAREGRLATRLLAPTGELLLGAAASESALARRDLGEFAILHFAAHAVADGAHPERSAVLLAPAHAGEDGLLQGREIGRLPLAGRLVVLSACRSAAGATAAGEGPLSLARAFQRAGALAVVASRWELRDDEAAETIGALYRRLAAGEPIGAALRGARREGWKADRPAAAWAALVLLGDPGIDVLAGLPLRRPAPWANVRWLAVALAVAAALLYGALRRRRRSVRSA